MNAQLLAHGIQLAVAPVFLLTAIAAMLGVVSGRLARIIDRARVLEQRLPGRKPDPARQCARAVELVAEVV